MTLDHNVLQSLLINSPTLPAWINEQHYQFKCGRAEPIELHIVSTGLNILEAQAFKASPLTPDSPNSSFQDVSVTSIPTKTKTLSKRKPRASKKNSND